MKQKKKARLLSLHLPVHIPKLGWSLFPRMDLDIPKPVGFITHSVTALLDLGLVIVLGLARIMGAVAVAKTKALGHLVENINVVVSAAEDVLARAHGVNSHVGKGMNTLAFIGGDSAVDNEATDAVLRVGIVVSDRIIRVCCRRQTRTVLADPEVLPVVRVGSKSLGERISRVPVDGEVSTGAVAHAVDGRGVHGEAGFLVRADGPAPLTVGFLFGHVPRVCIPVDIESVAVVGGDKDEGFVQDVQVVEPGNGGTYGVVKLEKVAKGTIVVHGVHLFINGGGLGHEEEAVVGAASGEDVDSLEGHLLQARQVEGGLKAPQGMVLKVTEIVSEDIAVEPGGQVALGKYSEDALLRRRCFEGRLVLSDLVALVGKFGIVVLALVGCWVGEELLGTSTKVRLGATLGGPGVIGHPVESHVNEGPILAPEPGVARQGDWGSIGDECGGHSTPNTAPDTRKQLDDRFHLGIIKRIRGRICVNAKSIDGALVASV